jgi:prepilin-type N-terminal cleavage/methylation domain-containing protein
MRGGHERHGFSLVEVVVTVTVVALVIGVFVDVLIVGQRKPNDSPPALAPAEAELTIARFVSKDVLPSLSATPRGTACGVRDAALVTTEKSVPTVAHADQAVVYSLGADGLSRSTCAPGAASAAVTALVSADVTLFIATCRSPGPCGTVHIEAATAVPDAADHHFSLDLARRAGQ